MGFSHHSHKSGSSRLRRPGSPALAVLWLALLVCGCGQLGANTGGTSSENLLVSGRREGSLGSAQLLRVRRAAIAFSRSYAASIADPARARLRDAVAALTAELRASGAQPPRGGGHRPPRVVGLELVPRSGSEVAATLMLAARGEAPFAIVFVLRQAGGRWLVTRLPGN